MPATIKEFNRSVVRSLGRDAVKAINAVLGRFGVTAEFNGGRFNSTEATLKVKLTIDGATSEDGTSEAGRLRFETYAWRHDLDGAYGQTFVFGSHTYRIVDYKPKSRRFPIVGKDVSTGKLLKFQAATVLSGLVPAKGKGKRR